MNVKVLTNVRADSWFLGLWIQYYGGLFGRENLHVMLDGEDWTPAADTSAVTLHTVTDVPETRSSRDNFIANWQSNLARQLLQTGTSVVLRVDVDEFVAVDPQTGLSLPDYLDQMEAGAMQAALGLDVIQGPAEPDLIATTPILTQRRNAVITHEFSKLVAVRKPPRWASGFHRGRKTPIDIGPGLLLFHLALFDRRIARLRKAERAGIPQHRSEGGHIDRRLERFAEMQGSDPINFDSVSEQARAQIMTVVPSPTGPHPGPITDGNSLRGYHVILPERFGHLLPQPVSVPAGP
jgi:hypothetical protein